MEKELEEIVEEAKTIECGWDTHPFINRNNEFIVDNEINAYFDMSNVKTAFDFKKKVVLELSYYCSENHWVEPDSQNILEWINEVMETELTADDMTDIYMFLSPFGGRCPELGDEFIRSGCDRAIIEKAVKKYGMSYR